MTGGRIKSPSLPNRLLRARLSDSDYEYLKDIFGLAGLSMTEAMTDVLTGLAHLFREVLGDDLTRLRERPNDVLARNLIRLTLIELGQAIKEKSSGLSRKKRTKKGGEKLDVPDLRIP